LRRRLQAAEEKVKIISRAAEAAAQHLAARENELAALRAAAAVSQSGNMTEKKTANRLEDQSPVCELDQKVHSLGIFSGDQVTQKGTMPVPPAPVPSPPALPPAAPPPLPLPEAPRQDLVPAFDFAAFAASVQPRQNTTMRKIEALPHMPGNQKIRYTVAEMRALNPVRAAFTVSCVHPRAPTSHQRTARRAKQRTRTRRSTKANKRMLALKGEGAFFPHWPPRSPRSKRHFEQLQGQGKDR
jgi:peptidyl-tRNA hydrolase